MEPAMTESNRMEKLDRILASEEEIAPSSGFAASVMERVREEAVAPQPIPFPWKRVLPALVIVAVGLAWCLLQMVRMALAAPLNLSGAVVHLSLFQAQSAKTAGWVVAALGISLLSWLLARRLVGRGEMV